MEELIGQTNASIVHRGHSADTPEEKLALKIVLLNPKAGMDEFSTYASLDERVSTYRNIDHPSIAALRDFFYLDTGVAEMPVVVREYIEGESMQEQIEQNHLLSPEQAMQIFRQLLEVSDYLETSSTREIVVRDIKPGNIIIDGDGDAHLTDLELCTSSGQSTTGGRGTISYMPPEQLVGGEPTSMWDRYAIAKTMEHLLTGNEPEHGKPVSLRDGINIPIRVRELLYQMTSRDARERPDSARKILLQLGNQEERGVALVPRPNHSLSNGSASLDKQLALVAGYIIKVPFDDDEKRYLYEFIAYASSMEDDDSQFPVVSQVCKAMRLFLEAKDGFTKEKEFMDTVRRLARQLEYDVIMDDETDDTHKIVLVDPLSNPRKVISIEGPNCIQVDYLKPGASVDDFVEEYERYSRGQDPQLWKKYKKKANLLENVIAFSWLGTLIGIGMTSIVLGLRHESWAIFGSGAGATTAAAYLGPKFHDWNYKPIWKKFRGENAKKFQDPREDHSYNLPSSVTKAFLPEYRGNVPGDDKK